MEVGFSALNTRRPRSFFGKVFFEVTDFLSQGLCVHLFCWDVILPVQSVRTAGYFGGTSIGFNTVDEIEST
jgi:hypothetical protein